MQQDATTFGSNNIGGVPVPPSSSGIPLPPSPPAQMPQDMPPPPTPSSPDPQPTANPIAATGDNTQALNELAELKQKAMVELQPLLGHLKQAPEESFKTTMMMVQSTDNHMLLNDAINYAKAIPDEQKRAQALLDVVNEANYFSQHVYGSK